MSLLSSSQVASSTTNRLNEQILQTPIDNNKFSMNFKLVAGIFSGFVAAAVLICIIVYIFKKFKSTTANSLSSTNINNTNIDRTEFNNDYNKIDTTSRFDEDDNIESNNSATKSSNYSVLLIYTYDCDEHYNVIKAFAHFLREICKLNVIFDYWKEDEIRLIGIDEWLEKYINSVNYVLIIWSIGARVKCSTKLNTPSNTHDELLALLNDYDSNINFSKLINDNMFQHSVSLILKSLKSNENVSPTTSILNTNLDKYLNIYFEYSNKNDISYKFDHLKTFNIMVDFKKFLQHIYLSQNFSSICNYLGIIIDEMDNNYVKLVYTFNEEFNENKKRRFFRKFTRDNETTSNDVLVNNENLFHLKLIYIQELYKQINETKIYFKKNPNWYENSLFNENNAVNNNNNNNNNSTLTLDSNLNANNLKESSLQSLNAVNCDGITTLSVSSTSLISINSLTANHSNSNMSNYYYNNNYYHDFFMNPLPSNIDSSYFHLLEEKLNNNKFDNLNFNANHQLSRSLV